MCGNLNSISESIYIGEKLDNAARKKAALCKQLLPRAIQY